MGASCFDEGNLSVGDEVSHVGTKPSGEHLRNDFRDRMYETDGYVIGDPLNPFLGNSTTFAELSHWRLSVWRVSK